MLSKEEVLHLLNEAKEVDRLETNRQEDLGNSTILKMNYSSNVSYLKWKL